MQQESPLHKTRNEAPEKGLQKFYLIREYARQGRLPWRRDNKEIVDMVACAAPSNCNVSNEIHLNQRNFEDKLKQRFSEDLSSASINALYDKLPEASAKRLLNSNQQKIAIGLLVFCFVFFWLAPVSFLILLNCMTLAIFLAIIIFRIYLALIAIKLPTGADDIHTMTDNELPIITILLPLYDEASSLQLLGAAISKIDYPNEKLDVKFLLEEDDLSTIDEAYRLGFNEAFDFVILPPSEPRTKPKACNHALYLARGDYIVIYDAEDMPESDQLKKAAAHFDGAAQNVACVQARLNYYNARENWLTKLFALEYALWFDSFLPALEHIGAPIPLGGTSNFFKTDMLRDIGGWDPYNVTEDADLGMRLARHGYKTSIINSTTYEEANSHLGNWIRQRSRWIKGYLQTWLVHMRQPISFFKATGWQGIASTQLFLAGTVLTALVNPILWAVSIYWLATGSDKISMIFPGPVMYISLATFVVGNISIIGLAMLAPLKRGWTNLCPFALLAPVYWWLTSVAAYKAVWQLFTKPSYWEKTNHILSFTSANARAATLAQLEK